MTRQEFSELIKQAKNQIVTYRMQRQFFKADQLTHKLILLKKKSKQLYGNRHSAKPEFANCESQQAN